MKARAAGGIEAVVKAISTHIVNADVCYYGCIALKNASEGSTSLQKEMCEKGGLAVLLKALRAHASDEDLAVACCCAIGVVLSSPETHSKYCTPEVIRAVEECYERHKESEIIKQFLLSLKREEDPIVHNVIARGICSKKIMEIFAFLRGGYMSESVYHSKCYVQQKAFRCLTCDKDKAKLYCEVCWKRDHQGHKGEEFFYPVRCATMDYT